jgi:hypothetical protein
VVVDKGVSQSSVVVARIKVDDDVSRSRYFEQSHRTAQDHDHQLEADVMRGPNSEYSRARIPSSLEVAHPFVAPKR